MSEQQCKPLPPLSEKDLKRFWKKVDKRGPDDCWQWTSARSTRGYGFLHFSGTNVYATRISWMLCHGQDPYPLVMRHKCHNPPCVNPAHLMPGTQKENMQDSVRDGRMASGNRNGSRTHPELVARGEKNGSHKLTGEDVLNIRNRYASGESCSSIAEDYGVHYAVVTKAVLGHSWKHIGGPIAKAPLDGHGERNRWAVLDSEKAEWVLRMRSRGWTVARICAELGVTQGAIWPIVYGRTWRKARGERVERKRHLTAEQRAEIRAKRASGAVLTALAKEYGMSVSAIGMLCQGITWQHDKA